MTPGRDVFRTDAAPAPVGAYPHARRVGDLLFLSGIGPRDPATNGVPGNVHDAEGRLISYDIDLQARAVFANVRAVLEASGARWEDLVDVTVRQQRMAIAVIGAETTAAIRFIGHDRQQFPQVVLGRPFTDDDHHASPQLLARLF